MSRPALVSIITATYNMGRYLPQTIASILAQDYPAWELIVVDDGSTDDTPDILARYQEDPRITVIQQANAGQTAAKNQGIAAARGELIGFCDADDTWLPDKLSRQVPCFAGSTRLGVVYGETVWVDAQDRPLPKPQIRRYSGRVAAQLLVDNFIPFCTALIRREALQEAGGFDPSLSMAIDYDLWLRIAVDYDFLYLPVPLARYRIWDGQMSRKMGERMENFFRIFESFLQRYPHAVTPAQVRLAWAHTYVTRGRWHAEEGRIQEAWRDYLAAFRNRPCDLRLWKSACKLLLGLQRAPSLLAR
jgi:glycosyltransferase involved in cell wall biosynthesis